MKHKTLFELNSVVAERQPKTDRLVLLPFLKAMAAEAPLNALDLESAHAVLVKWADLESSGRLAKLNETQMQGDFLAEVFGKALGYDGPTDGADVWHRHQHVEIAGQMAFPA